MSRAVAMRPDLYAAYLHGASQWDGSYAPIAENSVAIYIYMADGDEYYGSAKARSAYENLHEAYENAGWSDADIDQVLRIETPIMPSSTKRAFITTTVELMWFLMTQTI